jgi:precorrin-2 dehydrogenase/sirohydrochlorin ferrochelatase
MANLFPIFLKLEARRVLVVGGGPIAEQKLDGLLRAGADIHVVAPKANDFIQRLAAGNKLRWSRREYVAGDLDGVALVVAATGSPEINGRVYCDADSRSILCNAVDEPERCHFYYPAVVQRGDLQIAISTAGHSPALAQRIRRELEQRFDETYGEWLEWLGKIRRRLLRAAIDPERRRDGLHRLARPEVYDHFRRTRARRMEAAR